MVISKKYMQSLTLKGEFTDLNTYIHGMNKNRFIGARYKKDETERVWAECKVARLKPMKNPVFIVFEWFSPDKRKDKDNISYAKKSILDGLVRAGVLKNDGWDNILGFLDYFYINKTDPRVVISFYENPEKIKIEEFIDLTRK